MEADIVETTGLGSHQLPLLSQLGNIHSLNMDANLLPSSPLYYCLLIKRLDVLFVFLSLIIWTVVRQVLKFNLMESGLLSVFPWMTMAISANAGGWIADTLVSRGFSVTNVRKVLCISLLLFFSSVLMQSSKSDTFDNQFL